MSTVKLAHNGFAIITSASWSVSLATLASNTQSNSPVQTNSTNLFPYANIGVSITTAASAVSATGYVELWLLHSVDAGTTYPTPYTNGILIGSFPANANATAYSATFTLPEGLMVYKLTINNQTGAAFTAATVNQDFIYYTVV